MVRLFNIAGKGSPLLPEEIRRVSPSAEEAVDACQEILAGVRAGGDGALLGDPIPGPAFRCCKQDLQPGDLIVLFTDGIVEATDDRKRMFGLRRLAAASEGKLGEDQNGRAHV